MPQKVAAQDTRQTITQSVTHFFLGTLLSRVTGFLRESMLGAWMGATTVLANFLIAYRFSQLFRKLFGEGPLLSSFSPHFEALRHQDESRAYHFFRDLFLGLSGFLILLVIALEIGLMLLLSMKGLSLEVSDTLKLIAIMLPGVLFVCLYALFSAFLQTEKKYFSSSLAPIFFNITYITILYRIKDKPPVEGIFDLAVGITLAFFMQWVFTAFFTAPILAKMSWKKIRLWSPDIRHMALAMLMTMIGVGAVQINSFIDTLFAKIAHPAGPAHLYYAARLYQLPIALFSSALFSAMIPALTRAKERKDTESFRSLFQFAMQRNLIVMVPLTFLIFICGGCGVHFVYGRGAFDHEAVIHTTWCLWGYSCGLIPATMVLMIAPLFYVQKDFKTPLKGSLLSVLLNIILNGVLVYGFHVTAASVAFSTSIASMVNIVYLLFKLHQQDLQLFHHTAMSWLKKTVLYAAVSAGIVAAVDAYFNPGSALAIIQEVALFNPSFAAQLKYLILLPALFIACFTILAWKRVNLKVLFQK